MDGLLVIDKPVGPTSHDVVARLRRALRERRIGHTGTLDPLASGVLPLVIGKATRLARFYSNVNKRYRATIALGVSTDTYDAAGAATGRAASLESLPGRDEVERTLARFRGTYPQLPPAYSAKKVDGERAYDLARKGRAVELAEVHVTVEHLSLVDWTEVGPVIDVTCSAGFYVRALAHDLGQALGCGAHLAALRRTAVGGLNESAALHLDDAEREPEAAAGRLVPLRAVLDHLPAVALTRDGEVRAAHGNLIRPNEVVDREVLGGGSAPGERAIRLLAHTGDLVAIAEIPAGMPPFPLQPTVVLA